MLSFGELFDWEKMSALSQCYWPLFLFLFLLIGGAFFKIWPTKRSLLLFLIPVFFTVFFAVIDLAENSTSIRIIQIADVFVVFLLTVDIINVYNFRFLHAERKTDPIASLGKKHAVHLRIENHSEMPCEFLLTDDIQKDLNNTRGCILKPEKLGAREAFDFEYEFIPLARGVFKLQKIWVRAFTSLKLWKKDLELTAESTINVYPDLRQISQYEILARKQHLYQIGLKTSRCIGQDNDFERLRDYTQDDQYKFIDWKATARRNKLTVKDFQMNRSQRIIFMIDSGRMMMNRTKNLSFLDHAFNSMLMLSHIALKQGDEVGFMTFSEDVRRYLAPRSGLSCLNRLVHASFDIFPESVESRYDNAFACLEKHCGKRSLLIFISNIIDQRNSVQIESHLKNLTGKHLPLGIFLRDHALFDPLSDVAEPLETAKLSDNKNENRNTEMSDLLNSSSQLNFDSSLSEKNNFHQINSAKSTNFSSNRKLLDFRKFSDSKVFHAGAAAEILLWRSKVIQSLSARGTLTLDLFPEDLTAPLINKYLDIKARHLL